MMPKKKKTDLKLYSPRLNSDKPFEYGTDRIKELLAKTDEKTTYFPKAIEIRDLDSAMRSYVRDGSLKTVIQGKDVPVFFLTNERWGEFAKTWKFTDDDKNVPTPFLTIRKTQTEMGTRVGGKSNVPNGRLFQYIDVPIMDEGQEIFLRFKISQPVNIDLTYEIRFFTKMTVDVNHFEAKFIKNFRSIQSYISVKGNPMPILQQGITEESTVENIEGDRMYVKVYTVKLLGFLLFEEDFQFVKTTRKPRFVVRPY